jgi:hypothetical protein
LATGQTHTFWTVFGHSVVPALPPEALSDKVYGDYRPKPPTTTGVVGAARRGQRETARPPRAEAETKKDAPMRCIEDA